MLAAINPLLISGERLTADQLLVKCSADVRPVCAARTARSVLTLSVFRINTETNCLPCQWHYHWALKHRWSLIHTAVCVCVCVCVCVQFDVYHIRDRLYFFCFLRSWVCLLCLWNKTVKILMWKSITSWPLSDVDLRNSSTYSIKRKNDTDF